MAKIVNDYRRSDKYYPFDRDRFRDRAELCKAFDLDRDALLRRFENGRERYMYDPVFKNTIDALLHGADEVDVISSLLDIVDRYNKEATAALAVNPYGNTLSDKIAWFMGRVKHWAGSEGKDMRDPRNGGRMEAYSHVYFELMNLVGPWVKKEAK